MEKMNTNQISLKASSKKELCRMLQLEGDVYLPPLPQANHRYVANIISGKKKYIKNSALKAIQVPHLPALRTNDILTFARCKLNVDDYLPEFKSESKVPDRVWLCNVVYTLIPQEFKKFVMDGIRKSETMNVRKKAMEVEVCEEFAKMFKTSESYSKEHGRFSKLLGTGRKRKYQEMIEEDKEFRKEYAEEKEKHKAQTTIINDLKSKIERFEHERIILLEDQAKLAKLFDMGYIDNHGDPLPDLPKENDDMN